MELQILDAIQTIRDTDTGSVDVFYYKFRFCRQSVDIAGGYFTDISKVKKEWRDYLSSISR